MRPSLIRIYCLECKDSAMFNRSDVFASVATKSEAVTVTRCYEHPRLDYPRKHGTRGVRLDDDITGWQANALRALEDWGQ